MIDDSKAREFVAKITAPPAPGATPRGLQEAVVKVRTSCPKCHSGTDVYRRCWRCLDWVCDCGGLTGSVFMSQCHACSESAEAAVNQTKATLKAWVERVKGSKPCQDKSKTESPAT